VRLFRRAVGVSTDAWCLSGADARAMRASYAVTWQEPGAKPRSGRLELAERGLVFEGGNGNGPEAHELPYAELHSVHVTHAAGERLDGRPTLVVERRRGGPIRIASIVQPGIISELAEYLAVRDQPEELRVRRLLLVLPLRPGVRDQAAALLRRGPPFDPAEAGLDRHQVFLSEKEAIFAFEADEATAVERLADEPALWQALSGWTELVAGPPRLAEDVYSWLRPPAHEELFFEATPGPGDSEGGDVFAP
jgi:hypothetical protein